MAAAGGGCDGDADDDDDMEWMRDGRIAPRRFADGCAWATRVAAEPDALGPVLRRLALREVCCALG